MSKKLFDFAIGNPPYMTEAPGESTSDKPCYHYFMDEAFKVGDKVELITPARFLFNAGATPKSWNEAMLHDEHFKILHYEANASTIFANTAITGGIAISYRDSEKKYTPIEIFTPYDELNHIRQKVVEHDHFTPLSTIISGRTPYLFTDEMHKENPDACDQLSKGHMYDISSNAFQSLPNVFFKVEPSNMDCFRILGRLENKRAYCWIKKSYAKSRNPDLIGNWKVFLPKANGASGMIDPQKEARLISKPELGAPNDIATDTFICVGAFKTKYEAEAALKYIKTKFARALLGILKVTQINSKDTWGYVPIQNFTENSDINWNVSINTIDAQLYAKYMLNDDEKSFIESHIEEMV